MQACKLPATAERSARILNLDAKSSIGYCNFSALNKSQVSFEKKEAVGPTVKNSNYQWLGLRCFPLQNLTCTIYTPIYLRKSNKFKLTEAWPSIVLCSDTVALWIQSLCCEQPCNSACVCCKVMTISARFCLLQFCWLLRFVVATLHSQKSATCCKKI